jgi:hypothetical protein
MQRQRVTGPGALHLFVIGALALAAAPVQAATYTDNFNRTGYPTTWALGSSWVESENVAGSCDMSLHILSSTVGRTAQCTSSGAFGYWNDTFADKQYSKLKYSDADGNRDIGGPAVRISTSGTWSNATLYTAEYDRQNGKVRLLKYVGQTLNGSGTQIGTDHSTSLSAGDWLELHADGSSLTVKKNGTTLFTQTDSSISSGKAGMAVRSTGESGVLAWDDWEGWSDAGWPPSNQDTWNSGTSLWTGSAYSPTYSTAPDVCEQGSTEAFGTTIKRLTDAESRSVLYNSNSYATQNWFSADKTKVIVDDAQGGVGVVTRSGCSITTITPMAMNQEPKWHRTNSDRIYYHAVSSGQAQLKWRNVSGSVNDVLHTFTEYSAISGLGESDLSQDGCKLVFRGTRADNGAHEVFVYTLTSTYQSSCPSSGGKSSVLSVASNSTLDWLHITTPHPDRSSDVGYVVAGYTNFEGTGPSVRLYNLSMGAVATLANFLGHEDVGWDASGKQILVMLNAAEPSPPSDCQNSVRKWELPSTTPTCLMKGNPAIDWDLAYHIALPANLKSDWAYIGLYDSAGSSSDKFRREIIRLRTDGTGYSQVAGTRPWDRIAHNHSVGIAYEFTPRLSISHDGTIILWGTDFGGGTYQDAYEIVIP